MEPEPLFYLYFPFGVVLGIWAFRKFHEKQQMEAERKKNKDKYKDFRY
jgi:hypothetical protein